MRKALRRHLISNRAALRALNAYLSLRNGRAHARCVQERAMLPFEDVEQLSADIPRVHTDLPFDNALYGLGQLFKTYAGASPKRRLDAVIEHGLFIGSLVRWDEYLYPVKQVITFGDQRCHHLRQSSLRKQIVPVGPYIRYARSLLSNSQFQEYKQKWGRTMLVLPRHSVFDFSSSIDTTSFVQAIESSREQFQVDTVCVLLFWYDAQLGRGEPYQRLGYKTVCAGHRFDDNFLPRLRSIIELSDLTMSEDVGTHVGYAVALDKPHWIASRSTSSSPEEDRRAQQISGRNDQEWRTYLQERDEIASAFSVPPTLEITPQQREVVDRYWGLSYFRSPEQLRNLLFG